MSELPPVVLPTPGSVSIPLVGQSTTTIETSNDNGVRTRRKNANYSSIKYEFDDGSDEEEIKKGMDKKSRDAIQEPEPDYPYIEQFVGRVINAKTGDAEYLCKFQGRSYLHLRWLTFEQSELFIGEGYRNRNRLQQFERRLARDGFGDLEDIDDLDVTTMTVEKIIDQKSAVTDTIDSKLAPYVNEVIPRQKIRVTDAFLSGKKEELLDRMKAIIHKLSLEQGAQIFMQPVDLEEVPEYTSVILSPMDLGTINSRLMRECFYIGPSCHALFAADVRLVYKNCMEFNQPGSDIYALAEEQLKIFEKMYYDWILSPTAWKILPLDDYNRKEHVGRHEGKCSIAKTFEEKAAGFDHWKPWTSGCCVCEQNIKMDQMLLCDRCDGEYHTFCLSPPLKELPKEEWFCDYCILRKKYEDSSAVQASKASSNSLPSGKASNAKTKNASKMLSTIPEDVQFPMVHLRNEEDTNLTHAVKTSETSTKVWGSIRDVGKRLQATLVQSEDKLKGRNRYEKLFLVKWQGLSYANSTWELEADIDDENQIQRYYKFNKPPAAEEIRRTTCQLPCCASSMVDYSSYSRRSSYPVAASFTCERNKFCVLGKEHEGECSNELSNADYAEGSRAYIVERMKEQIKAQMFAYQRLISHQIPDEFVLQQCGIETNALLYRKHYFNAPKEMKTRRRDEVDDDYSDDDSDSGSDDEDEDEEGLDYFEVQELVRQNNEMTAKVNVSKTGSTDLKAKAHQSKSFRTEVKHLEREISSIVSGMVEHIALGREVYDISVLGSSQFPENAMDMFTTVFCEYSIVLEKTPLGLGMRLGLTGDGMAKVLGFQPLPGGFQGPAERTGVIQTGDILVAVNQQPVFRVPFQHIIQLISSTPNYVLFQFQGDRPITSIPATCKPRTFYASMRPYNEFFSSPNIYIPFPYYNTNHPDECSPLRVGNDSDDAPLIMENFIRIRMGPYSRQNIEDFLALPSGPLQHLIHGVNDNSIDPYDHFAAFLPVKVRDTTQDKEIENPNKKKGSIFIEYEKSPIYKGSRTLREYQVAGLNWLIKCWKKRQSCILADEMGLGKTIQVVTFVEHLRTEEDIRGPFLIVVPLSTIQHWRREIEEWTDMNVCVYHDTGDRAKCTARDVRCLIRENEWYFKGMARRLPKFNVLLTTYETVLADFEEFEAIHWRLCVVDEAHRLKNSNSRVLKQMRLLHVDRRVLLTGTPLQNNTTELWVLLNFLEPIKFGNFEEFNENFGKLRTQEQVTELQTVISPYILRRVKEDVEKSIPPKEETIIEVELTTLQKRYYRAIYEKNRSYLYKGVKNGLPTLNNIQLQLRKCCNHPFLITGVAERELEALGDNIDPVKEMELTIQASGKFVLVSKLLPKLKREGHKVLIFSQFIRQLDFLERYCEYMGFAYERLDGSTQAGVRQAAIDRFSKANSKTFVFLLSTKAGGVGINLIAADTVIIFDSDWNPQNDLQAQSRCHRIGQEKSVKIYRLVTRNTYESEMFDRASKKLGLEHAILGTGCFSEDHHVGKPTAEQLVQLLKRGAYGLLDDDDTEARNFVQKDIEDILKESARIRVVKSSQAEADSDLDNISAKLSNSAEDTGDESADDDDMKSRSGYTALTYDRSSFTAEGATGEISVDDPNFWEKVLPGVMSIEMLRIKLKDGSIFKTDQTREKFIENLSTAVEDIIDEIKRGTGLRHIRKRRKSDKDEPKDVNQEYDIAIEILRTVVNTKVKKKFSSEELRAMEVLLESLVNSRVRSCRISRGPMDDGVMQPVKKTRMRRGRPRLATQNTDEANAAEILETPQDVLESEYGPNNDLCSLCWDGGLILFCDGPCHRSFHLECLGLKEEPTDEVWLCPDCVSGKHMCMACGEVGKTAVEGGVFQCSVQNCGRFYHYDCVSKLPKVQWCGKKRFRCPSHFCNSCELPKSVSKISLGRGQKKILNCTHCPVAYHLKCLHGGDTIKHLRLSKRLIICEKHLTTDSGLAEKAGRRQRETEDFGDTDTEGSDPEEEEAAEDGMADDDDYLDPKDPPKKKRLRQSSAYLKGCEFCSTIPDDVFEAKIPNEDAEGNSSEDDRPLVNNGPAEVAKDIEGDFIDVPIRLQFPGGKTERVFAHVNCALYSAEVFVNEEGKYVNLTRAIKRGRASDCLRCKQRGATIGCSVESCKMNYHLRCGILSGGEFLRTPYTFYCQKHAASLKRELDNASLQSSTPTNIMEKDAPISPSSIKRPEGTTPRSRRGNKGYATTGSPATSKRTIRRTTRMEEMDDEDLGSDDNEVAVPSVRTRKPSRRAEASKKKRPISDTNNQESAPRKKRQNDTDSDAAQKLDESEKPNALPEEESRENGFGMSTRSSNNDKKRKIQETDMNYSDASSPSKSPIKASRTARSPN